MSVEDLAAAVRDRLEPYLLRRDVLLRQEALAELAARVVVVTDGVVESDAALATALVRVAASAMTRHTELDRRRSAMALAADDAKDVAARKQILAEHLSELATDHVQLVRDLAALRRWMDHEALFDRLAVLESDQLDIVEIAYSVAAGIVREMHGSLLGSIDIRALLDLAAHVAETSRNETIRVAALRFVVRLIERFPGGERLMVLGVPRFAAIVEWARDVRVECWVRVAALEVIVTTLPGEAMGLLTEQLRLRDGRDAMVVRNNALRLLPDVAASYEDRLRVALFALEDPSEHVRQGLCRSLSRLQGAKAARALANVARKDASPRVRAVAIRQLAAASRECLDSAQAFVDVVRDLFSSALVDPKAAAPVVLQMACRETRQLVCRTDPILPPEFVVQPLSALLEAGELSLDVLEEVGELLRATEVYTRRDLDELRRIFVDEVRQLAEGEHTVVELFPETPLEDVEKAAGVAVRGDFACSCEPLGQGRFRLTRGEVRRHRTWRLLFELSTPAPDKRQGYAHTFARADNSRIVVPPVQMGEVTPTRVPGERRMIDPVRGWGVFLPLVDDLLAATRNRRAERRVVTSFGTVVLRAPTGLWRRVWARVVLTFFYASFARARESALASTDRDTMRSYAARAKRLGFRLSLEGSRGQIRGQGYEFEPRRVTRYLSVSAGAAPLWLEPLVDTALRPGGNTAWHLALIVWFALSVMVVRAAWQRERIERARRVVPLTIGGWGSRGKSGTERIKAALFHALRYDVVVKTTGCEAMFIHARRDQPARELFVYRPYGKATIWEQEKLLGYAERLRAQVFLWECMALRPQFVQILQNEWMRDNITTLTNAYPDHEDVMGPSGEDVARVIASFMPRNGAVFTAEQEMLPVIAESARRLGNQLVAVSDLEAQLLPQDLLDRYPYAEHPRNIALMMALGEHFDVDREWSIVKMADYVVPDLGVLKTYPTVAYLGRYLTFSNGMSANERAGFLSNWTRLGFDQLDLDEEPDTVIVAVVNNRADRVPRSRVFAELLTRDAPCDHVVLIGTNLGGMRAFIEEAVDGWLPTLDLGTGDLEEARANLRVVQKRMRVLVGRETLRRRLHSILTAAGKPDVDGAVDDLAPARADQAAASHASGLAAFDAETDREQVDVARHVQRLLDEHREAMEAARAIDAALVGGDRMGANKRLRAWFRRVSLRRVSVVEDSHAKGDQVIHHVAREVAPGHKARILGCQNIKGTGLDFAYRWVSVGQVAGALQRLESEPATRPDTLRWLAAHGDYGIVDTIMAHDFLQARLEGTDPQWEELLPQLQGLVQQLSAQIEKKRSLLSGAPKKSWLSWVLDHIEPFVDHLDSIRRQKQARRVMQALYSMRVSQAQASILLREITDRSKGGWLAGDYEAWKPKRRGDRGPQPP